MSNVGKILWRDDAGERQTAKPQEKRSVEGKKYENKQKKNKEEMAAAEISTCLSTFFILFIFVTQKKML